jgi:hypothetical protein
MQFNWVRSVCGFSRTAAQPITASGWARSPCRPIPRGRRNIVRDLPCIRFLGLRTVSNAKILNVAGIGSVQLTVEELGDGKPYLVSHGRAGPQSVAAFTQLLAEEGANRVITPTHPGFGGTPRPDELNSVVSDGDPATRAARDPEPGLNQPFSCVRVVTGPF